MLNGRLIVLYSPVTGNILKTTIDTEPVYPEVDKQILDTKSAKLDNGQTVAARAVILNSYAELRNFEVRLKRAKEKQ